MPGDRASMDVTPIAPIAMGEGHRFAIREGGNTMGAGVIASISVGTPGEGSRALRPPVAGGALRGERASLSQAGTFGR